MADKKLVFYIDWASQPSRACMDFCKRAKIPFEINEIRISRGQNKSKEFLTVNPMGQVPAMQETDGAGTPFTLAESHAILKYLCDSRKVEDHWYPTDLRKRAVVEQYLSWHHNFLR